MLRKIPVIIYSTILGIIFFALLCAGVSAAPICPVPMEYTQPDGSTVTLISYGDEFFSWKEDESGNIVAYDSETDSYKYAKIEDGSIRPGSCAVGETTLFSLFSSKLTRDDIQPLIDGAERTDYTTFSDAPSAIDEAGSTKPLTNQKLLMIMIEFNDVKFVHDGEFWHNKFFSTNPDDLSVVNYWKENSGGLDLFVPADTSGVTNKKTGTASYSTSGYTYTDVPYTVTKCPDGVVKVSLDMPHPIRTWNDEKNPTAITVSMIELSVEAIKDEVDVIQDDLHVMATFAGYNNSVGYGAGLGEWSAYTGVGLYTSDGELVGTGAYSIQGEMISETTAVGIGTACHELGHSVFDLPDLYMTNFPGGGWEENGIAMYSLMAFGCWGSTEESPAFGSVPTHLDAYSKIKLGYVTPEIVTNWDGDVNSVDLDNYGAYNVLQLISSADPNQCFLIENRQLVGYDKGFWRMKINFWGGEDFRGGIVIYHIDERAYKAYAPNNNMYHRFITVERAVESVDGRNTGSSVWTFNNTDGRNKFNAETEPNSNFHALGSLWGCKNFTDCHPQTLPSGISIEILSESNSSMRIKTSIDDEYILGGENASFAELFPDENFCAAVVELLNNDDYGNRDGNTILTASDWAKILTMETLNVSDRGIEDLSGIENFRSLIYLICSNNKISNLDATVLSDIHWLYCENNQLQQLNISGCESLVTLRCNNNTLEQLDIGDISLRNIFCYENNMGDDPKKSIIGIGNELTILNETSFVDEYGRGYKYYPQNNGTITTPTTEPSTTPVPTETTDPTATPTVEPTEIPEPYSYPYRVRTHSLNTQYAIISGECYEKKENTVIIFVVYSDDGRFVSVQIKNLDTDGEDNFTEAFQYIDGMFKVFIWDMNTQEPYSEVYSNV